MSTNHGSNADSAIKVELEQDSERGEFDGRIDGVLAAIGEPYDCTVEQEPALAAYHPSFKRAEECCNTIYARAASLIKDSDYEDDETKQLLGDINNVGEGSGCVVYPALSRVGLIGNSGAGKCHCVSRL